MGGPLGHWGRGSQRDYETFIPVKMCYFEIAIDKPVMDWNVPNGEFK